MPFKLGVIHLTRPAPAAAIIKEGASDSIKKGA